VAAAAGAPARELTAVRATAPPVIDGKLDDACWAAAKPATGFLGIDSDKPAAAQTVGYVLYDDNCLYVAARCLEPDLRRVSSSARAHDAFSWREDIIEIMIDPGRTQDRYVQLAVNPSGSTFDCYRSHGGRSEDDGWDGVWQAAGSIGTDAWFVETAIPFASLGLSGPVGSTWGFNLCREKPNPTELSSLGERGAFNHPERFAVLRGLESDFSRFRIAVGPAVTNLRASGKAIAAVVSAPVVNLTGRAQNLKIAWESESWGAAGKLAAEKTVTLAPGAAETLSLPPVPLEANVSGPNVRLMLATMPRPVKIRVFDQATGQMLGAGVAAPAGMVLQVQLDVNNLYTRAAFEQPARDLSLVARTNLDPSTLKSCSLQVSLRRARGAGVVAAEIIPAPQAVTKVTFPGDRLAWGGYIARAEVKDAGGQALVAYETEVPLMPRGAERVRVLNNLVTELLNAPDISGTATRRSFMNPRTGWVLVRCSAKPGAGGKVTVTVPDAGQHPEVITITGSGTQTREAMRWLPIGRHEVKVSATGGATVGNLIVRAIPEIGYCRVDSAPQIKAYGADSWEWLEQHILPHINLAISHGGEDERAHWEAWARQGKRWIAESPLPGLSGGPMPTADEVYRYWKANAHGADPLIGGLIVDEFGAGNSPIWAAWHGGLRQLAADPDFAGKVYYPYCGPLFGSPASQQFAQTVLDHGWAVALERYLPEAPSEQAAREKIRSEVVDTLREWASVQPEVIRHCLIVWGFFISAPPESTNSDPSVNYATFMEMQMAAAANDPALFGLYGMTSYLSGYGDAEYLAWYGKLCRHYCIEGRTDRLLREYKLPYLQNPDFADGLQGWQATPAAEGSITTASAPGISWLQGRYPPTAMGDTFVLLKRSAKGPNAVSQTIQHLRPGRVYSVKMIAGDYGEFQAGKSRSQVLGMTLSLGPGAEIVADRSFQYPYASNYAHVHGDFNRDSPYWMNLYRVVFRARAKSVTLTLSDWSKPGQPGGPVGQEIWGNFLEVQPYVEE